MIIPLKIPRKSLSQCFFECLCVHFIWCKMLVYGYFLFFACCQNQFKSKSNKAISFLCMDLKKANWENWARKTNICEKKNSNWQHFHMFQNLSCFLKACKILYVYKGSSLGWDTVGGSMSWNKVCNEKIMENRFDKSITDFLAKKNWPLLSTMQTRQINL